MSKHQTYMQTAEALGTTIELRLATASRWEAEAWLEQAWGQIYDFERRFSRFRPDSEVTALNQQAGKKISVSLEFRELLLAMQEYARITGGLFNPFVLPAVQRAGYLRSMTSLGQNLPVLDYRDRRVVPAGRLEIGDGWARIPTGTAIDTGGIGKGYLADQVAAALQGRIKDFCLSFGGDMLVSGRPPEGDWLVEVQSANDPERAVATYRSGQERFALATSGNVRIRAGRVQPHQVDSRTGGLSRSTFDICTVVAEDATTADVIASAMLQAGESSVDEFRESGVKSVLLQAAGLPPQQFGSGFTILEAGEARGLAHA